MPTQSIKLKQEDVRGLSWTIFEETEDFRRSYAVVGHEADGSPVFAIQTEMLEPTAFLESVKAERNHNEGQRWSQGLGSDKNGNLPFMKIGSVPMNLWARDLAPRAADRDFKKWWWAQEANAPFRTRKGDL